MTAYYDEDEEFVDALSVAESRRGWRAKVSIAVGAVVAVAIVGGVVAWSYNLGTRSPDEIPIIRAAAGPAKERPTDPGGAVTPHQDVLVYEIARPGAPAVEEKLAPAAPRPAPEDVAMGKLAPEASGGEGDMVAALVGGVSDVVPEGPLAPETGPSPIVVAEQKLIEESLQQVLAEPASSAPTPPQGSGSENAPAYSPVVRGKPTALVERSTAAAAEAEESETALAQAAATSEIQVQLGAFPDRADVDAVWDRVYKANRDILSGRALAVQQTVSGGTVYYRLRVGPFRDGHEANTVCQALKARGQDCLVAINTDQRG